MFKEGQSSAQAVRSGKNNSEKQPYGCQGQKKEGEEELLQPMERLWWNRYFPAAHGEGHAKARICTAAHGGVHAGADGYFLRELWPAESPCWSRFTLEDCRGMKRTCARAGE